MAVVAGETLSPEELFLIGQLRRLKRDAKDFRIEILGGFQDKQRVVKIRPCPYYEFLTPRLTETEFAAIE